VKSDDPVSQGAERAIAHLNEDHDDALLDMARTVGGCPEASAARCVDADRTGLDLIATVPTGETEVRVPYAEPIDGPEGLRAATVKLAHAARAQMAGDSTQSPAS
jgi:heme oxygenase (biliverdin-IX-beta and delta-forming)